ncbi:Ldh family oxidoreductase [Halosolutus halophilus]|uniref:Ldh family oxidoreductase n=1 Tax=Halosolutus halophilus TaxID=1552990 RepID=UPI00223524E8|nr:Ldh family oxidoreductase [Halosolutus halophilus]
MRVEREPLHALACDAVESLGAPSSTATAVADSLVAADARTPGTHGVGLLPLYAEMVADDAIDPCAEPDGTGDDAITVVEGNSAFGALTGRTATAHGVAVARDHGIAAVGIRDGTHLGRLGEWAERATAEGLAFLMFANAGGGAQNTAPFGGHKRKLSTNPLAVGIPTFEALPFDIVVDVATSQVSGSVVRNRHLVGRNLRDAWTTTASGDPVTDPAAFMHGEGALLPLGGRETGHKGYGLSVAVELFAALVGGHVVGERNPDWFGNAACMMFLDPSRFGPLEEFEDRVNAVATHLRSDEVRLPGEGAHRRLKRSKREGIAVEPSVLSSLVVLARDHGVEVPEPIEAAAGAVPDEADTDHTDDVSSW